MISRLYYFSIIIACFFSVSFNKYTTIYAQINIVHLWIVKKNPSNLIRN